MNWLDPEPDADSSDYEEYIEKFQKVENNVNVYHGFHQPPTEEEYHDYGLGSRGISKIFQRKKNFKMRNLRERDKRPSLALSPMSL